MSKVPSWWEHLNHGGLLIGPAQLEEHYLEPLPQLGATTIEYLRRAVVRLEEGDSSLSSMLDTVLENVLGLEAQHWIKNPGAEWTQTAITKERIRPRRIWAGPNGAVLPVFDTRSVLGSASLEKSPRIGIGRGRQMVSRVIEWLRQDHRSKIALLTTGRQWRLIHAGETFDAWCEWDASTWFPDGQPGPQVDALRQLLGRESITPQSSEEKSRLNTAIVESRRGEADLTSALGERVRRAVEHLIQASTKALDTFVGTDSRDHYNEIYIASTRLVMRCVVALFAESREMLPVGELIYHNSYGIRGLRELLDQTPEDTLRESHAGWARLVALFRLLYEGSDHGQFPVVRYGGKLFEPGNPSSEDPVSRAIHVFESSDGPSDLDLKQVLDLLGKTFTKLRHRRGARPFAVPVDFSAMDTEYIGILYEGLLDFNLKRASEPIVFLQIGDYPALPWSTLRGMEQPRLEALLENLKKKSTIQVAEDGDDGPPADDGGADQGDPGQTLDTEDGAELQPSISAADALDADVFAFAINAVRAAGLIKAERGKKTLEKIKIFEEKVTARARSLFRVIRKGEWYLVRFGNTRKGSGTFYTRPQLAAPTVRRTLQPLCYFPDGTPKTPDEILSLKVCDPSMGSGSFLISAVRFLTRALLSSLYHYDRVEKRPGEWICRIADGLPAERVQDDTAPLPGKYEDAEVRLKARLRRYVMERCIYGVDIDDMAVELGRMALWIETMDRELPFGFLDHKIRAGNALVGCWFDRFEDYPATAWLREGGDKDYNPVNAGRGNWTEAIAARLKERVLPSLERFISLNKQSAFQFQDKSRTPAQVHDQAMRLLDEMHALPVQDVEERRAKYLEIRNAPEFRALLQAFDLWCAIWFWPGNDLQAAPLPADLIAPSPESIAQTERLKRAHRTQRFFHWELEFPDVFGGDKKGFDAVVGNPPWEIQKPNSKEFFSNLDPLYRGYGKTEAEAEQKKWFAKLPQVEFDWLAERARLKALSNWVKNAGRPFGDYTRSKANDGEVWVFPFGRFGTSQGLHTHWRKLRASRKTYADGRHPFLHQGSADLNTYKMFLEVGYRLLRDQGRLGFIVPSGVYSDKGSTEIRTLFLDHSQWEWLFGFENRDGIFDIHRSFKFASLIVEKGGKTNNIRAAFMQRSISDWEDGESFALDYPRERILQFSPYTRAILEIREPAELRILEKMYSASILLGSRSDDGWRIRYATEFHMTNDAKKGLFLDRGRWESEGYIPDEYGHWLQGGWEDYNGPSSILLREKDLVLSRDGSTAIRIENIKGIALPLYEGRMIGQFDFSQKGWVSGKGRAAKWDDIPFERKVIKPQFLMGLQAYSSTVDREGKPKSVRPQKLAFMDVTSATNARTMIAACLMDWPAGNSAPVFQSSDIWGLVGTLNSFAYDYVARAKCTGLHLNWFVVEESTVPRPTDAAIIGEIALRLIGVSSVFAPAWRHFRRQGRSWRELWAVTDHERLRLRCILDAVVAQRYGLTEDDLRQILRDCDHPVSDVTSDDFSRRLDPKGFWRIDKDLPPECRQTVLTQVAFRGLGELGLHDFVETWQLPKALNLADFGLGRDERAKHAQPVASVLGPQLLSWQTMQSAEESWEECLLHAELLEKIVPPPLLDLDDGDGGGDVEDTQQQLGLNFTR